MSNFIKNKIVRVFNSGLLFSGTSSSFTSQINLPQNLKFDYVTCMGASIPVSYYLLQAGFNTFTLSVGSTQYNLSLIPGNYGIDSFCDAVATLLNALSVGTFTLSYNNGFSTVNDGLIYYTSTATGVVSLSFPSNSAINEQFGFSRGSTVTFIGGILTSTTCTSFLPENTILIHSDLADNQGDDILQEIYAGNLQPFSIIHYQSTAPIEYSKKLRIPTPLTITLSLTDEYNIPLNLNGVNCCITLLFYQAPEDAKVIPPPVEPTRAENITPPVDQDMGQKLEFPRAIEPSLINLLKL
jgi:hypothetical protein